MKLKLDENLGHRASRLFRGAGHEIATVHSEELCSASDERVIGIARDEERCLVTLDREFGNPLLYKPSDYRGIAVLRLPANPNPHDLEESIRTLLKKLDPDISGHLWIVEKGRIRIYQGEDEGPFPES